MNSSCAPKATPTTKTTNRIAAKYTCATVMLGKTSRELDRSRGSPLPVIGELRELARAHAPEAIKELARLAVKAKSESARISAIRELLDRGFGKPTQFLAGDSEIIPKGATLEQLREDILIEFAASFPDLEIVPKKRLTMIAGTDEAN